MTLAILLNSALRMWLIGAAVWLVLRLLRARNPHVEVLAWRMTLLAGLLLPALLYWGLAPRFDTVELPAIVSGAVAGPASAPTRPAGTMPIGLLASIYLAVSLLLLAFLWWWHRFLTQPRRAELLVVRLRFVFRFFLSI